MEREEADETLIAIQEALKAGAKLKAQADREEVRRRFRMTSWGPGTVRKSQPCMFGEGYGNNMLLDPPKYTKWSGPQADPPVKSPEEIQLAKKTRSEKIRSTRARKQSTLAFQQRLELRGEVLHGQRIFLLSFPFRDWERRAKAFGGIPTGVDVAGTDFGDLLLVPVVEGEDGAGIREKAIRDRQGRDFWVAPTMRESVQRVFGEVAWKRPLMVSEVQTQFGIKLG